MNHTIGDSFYTCSVIGKEGNLNFPIKIAEEVLAVLPMKRISFMCTHAKDGIRIVRGFIYENKEYGIFIIEDYSGTQIKISLQGNMLRLIQ